MSRKFSIIMLSLFFCCNFIYAQEEQQKSKLHQRAETYEKNKDISKARSVYIDAFDDYAGKGQVRTGIECAVKAAVMYCKENAYKEAFELLHRADQAVRSQKRPAAEKEALHYLVTKERLQMYIKLKKTESAKGQLNIMESQVNLSGDENLKNDLLYNKAIFYYTFGQNTLGNAVFKEMANRLTAQKEYDKVEEVYQTLIANGKKSGNANLVAQSYSSYIVWKDSVNALKAADVVNALKQQIADNEATIAGKDHSLDTRKMIIIGLCVLALALTAGLVVGGFVLMRFIFLTRRQKKTINLLNESNALKAKFISNISAQMEPTLKKFDSRQPEVKALLNFSANIQKLSELENTPNEDVTLEEVQLQQYCNSLMDGIRDKVKDNVTLTMNVSSTSAKINQEYVSHILNHLLKNAAAYTPENGTICLDFKKRGPHTFQFLVSNTGSIIPEEKREDVFKPFLEIKDLTKGDGLGLPICKQMALKMNGDLEIDPKFTKGTRFILDWHA